MTVKQRVEQALHSLRSHLQADGGDIELIDVNCKDGIVKIKLTGACNKCPMSHITVQNKIKKVIQQYAPEIKEIYTV
ncbi:MAG: NifU family protein [Endomicrobium sp.]|jgi:Fe-S cluster biogenesis protein NfuA|nr:NifU family protein [Endomicrobium sp.]